MNKIGEITEQIAPYLFRLVLSLIVLTVGLILVHLLVKKLKKTYGTSRIERSKSGFYLCCIKVSLNVLVIITSAMVFGFTLTEVLAIAGMLIIVLCRAVLY